MARRQTRKRGGRRRKSRRQNNNASWNANTNFGAIQTNVLAETNEEKKARANWKKQFNNDNIQDVTKEVEAKEKMTLPPGWRAYRYKNGDVYYGHKNKKNSQYEFPIVTRAGNAPNLPKGWKTYVYQGKNFYMSNFGHRQFEKPTEEAKANVEDEINTTPPPPPEPTEEPVPARELVENTVEPRNTGEPAPAPMNTLQIKRGNNNISKSLLNKIKSAQNIVANLKQETAQPL